MPENYRAAIVLCLVEGMTHEQAARQLGCPVGTVQSRLARGRAQLRDRLARRGLAPALVAFGLGVFAPARASATVSALLAEATLRSALRFAVPQSLPAAEVSSGIVTLTEGVLKMMALSRMKSGLGALRRSPVELHCSRPASSRARSIRADGPATPPRPGQPVAAPITPVAAPPGMKPHQVLPKADPDADLPAGLVRPRPWETTVRLKIDRKPTIGFGSGTIIFSKPGEALILTCAHNAKLDSGKFQMAAEKITVDLFDGKIETGSKPAQVHYVNESYRGEAVAFDARRDLGLVRIHPSRVLPVSPLVPPRWRPVKGSSDMVAVGCSTGLDATVWATTVIQSEGNGDASRRRSTRSDDLHDSSDARGASGGGLFTADGFLAGVCLFAAPATDQGLYATPDTIYKFLENVGMSAIDQRDSSDQPRGDEPRKSTASSSTETSARPTGSVNDPRTDGIEPQARSTA